VRRCILAAGLLLAGCSAEPLNIVILSARAPGDSCDFSDDTKYVSRGSLDLAPYYIPPAAAPAPPSVTSRFYQVFSWQNNLQAIPLSVGGQIVDPGSGNEFIADTAVYEYQYSDPSVVLTPEQANMHAVIAAGGDSKDNSVPADLIQPNAFKAINASTAINTSNQTLIVTFQLSGKTLAGASQVTNKVTFPLTIYRSTTTPITCGAGTAPTGECSTPGRDGNVTCGTTP